MHEPVDPAGETWDAIVIGTGMGGGTHGHALARAGLRVLFLEKGKAHPGLLGDYPEKSMARPLPVSGERAVLADAGRCWEEIEDHSQKRVTRHVPFIGAGAGGSSALYGMVLERFFPDDFTPRRLYPDAADADLPESWPFSYAELVPYYEQAERLYRVRGQRDPLRREELPRLPPPPPLPANQQRLHDHFVARGLHPYHLPLACELVPECQHCQSYRCPLGCKNDSARVCLEPALREHGAQILDECEVIGLRADGKRVTGVFCEHRGRRIELRAGTVTLAAGALYTPAILLRSRQDGWPEGLANRSGLVGRNLMRHYVDLYLVKTGVPGSNRDKALGLNDFYQDAAGKLGTLQSFGALPPAAMLVESLQDDLRQSALPLLATLIAPAKPLIRMVLARLTQRVILASLLEDLPYRDNRVLLSGRDVAIHYRLSRHEQARIRRMRATMKRTLAGLSPILIKQAENNQRLAHVCGTCRAGMNPSDSVLDADCRAHDLENLYVVDASFFPSSAGTNPALTIAANALRVAEHILKNSGASTPFRP
jgi:choline dehydrogenase-like flavoprotein